MSANGGEGGLRKARVIGSIRKRNLTKISQEITPNGLQGFWLRSERTITADKLTDGPWQRPSSFPKSCTIGEHVNSSSGGE